MAKNDSRTNILAWLRQIPFIDYGYIDNIIDDTTVEVKPVLQETEESTLVYTVTLLSLSSALAEVKIKPKLNDLVLLFSPRKYNPLMFDDPVTRPEDERVIRDRTENGYSMNSMVGLLMKSAKTMAKIILEITEGETDADQLAALTADADIIALFRKSFNVGFESKDGEKYPLKLYIDRHHPTDIRQNSDNTFEQGIDDIADDKREEVPVTQTKIMHGQGFFDWIWRSSIKLIFGIGNDETEDEEEERRLTLDMTVGEETTWVMTIRDKLTLIWDIGKEWSKTLTVDDDAEWDVTIGDNWKWLNTVMDNFVFTWIFGDGGVTDVTIGSSPVNVTSADDFNFDVRDYNIVSKMPITIQGGNIQLGSGNLRPYWTKRIRARLRNVHIPPAIWPRMIPVPPAPPLTHMAFNGRTVDEVEACTEAITKNTPCLD
jgi:hypothetical protein